MKEKEEKKRNIYMLKVTLDNMLKREWTGLLENNESF